MALSRRRPQIKKKIHIFLSSAISFENVSYTDPRNFFLKPAFRSHPGKSLKGHFNFF